MFRLIILSFGFVFHISVAFAVPVNINNHSFENDLNNFNEFFFGDPQGWELLDPGNINSGGNFQGTLTPSIGGNYFSGSAPDGNNVAILYLSQNLGTSEFGLGQVLSTDLAANTQYTLSVDVGNINSGDASNGDFFDLSGFPGYRIELLAGGVLLASDSEGINSGIGEGLFEQRDLVFNTGANPLPNQALEVRLYNLNIIDPAFPGVDLEVDFDNIRLDATAIITTAEPSSLILIMLSSIALFGYRRRTRK